MRAQPRSADPTATPERDQLPTRQQLALIEDAAALADIRDAIDRAIARIETDLEYGDRDDDWADRARNALFFHRYTLRLVERRAAELGQPRTATAQARAIQPTGRRGRDDCDQLTLELLDGWSIAPAQLDLAEVAFAITAYDARIHALQLDRADENDRPNQAKDHPWLQRAKAALQRARGERNALCLHQAQLRRAEKPGGADGSAKEATRERLFIEAAREILDRPTYLALWARVEPHVSADPAGRPEPALTQGEA